MKEVDPPSLCMANELLALVRSFPSWVDSCRGSNVPEPGYRPDAPIGKVIKGR